MTSLRAPSRFHASVWLPVRVIGLTLVFTLAFPVTTFAAAISALSVPDTATVSRGDFLQALVKTLKLDSEKADKSLPYGRVQTAYLPAVSAAHKRDALKTFGTTLSLEKAITRGEALQVTAAFLHPGASETIPKVSFGDVPAGSDLETAVALAVAKQWMKPARAKTFGVRQALTGREGRQLLDRIAPQDPKTVKISIPVYRSQTVNSAIPKEDVLRATWKILQEGYLYKDKLDADAAGDRAIEAFVKSLNDPYTVYLPKAKTQNFSTQIKGEVEGIGATVEQTGGLLYIISPLTGSPAEKAGLKPKDVILSADGADLRGLSLEDAVGKVRGPKGSSVMLKILRDGNTFEVSVTRAKVTIPEVEISFQGGIAIIKLLQFGETTDKALRSHMIDVQKKNPKGVIVDLRNNPGGLLHAAGAVVGNFVPKGTAFASIKSREGVTQELTEDEPTIDASVPVVVLINKGSASASELTAGALRDLRNARILGETSFGKGSVQRIVQFTDGSSLKFTMATYLLPSGAEVNGIGIKPDEVITSTNATRDEVLLRALDLLR